jgi:polyisoprenoid-binding protein YceI
MFHREGEEMTIKATPQASRTIDGRAVPAPGIWDLDPAHVSATFEARHMVIAKARGRFNAVTGVIVVEEDVLESSVDVSIDVASLDSGDSERDAHLLSGDFLDVDGYSELTFRSTGITPVGRHFTLEGELTIKGVSRPVAFDLEFNGATIDPWGNQRAGFSASTEIDRTDWGLTWNMALEAGGMLVGKSVKIVIDAEAVRRA